MLFSTFPAASGDRPALGDGVAVGPANRRVTGRIIGVFAEFPSSVSKMYGIWRLVGSIIWTIFAVPARPALAAARGPDVTSTGARER